MVVEHTLEQLLQDAYAFCWNNHYKGWEYRVASEGYDAVAKDCDASAKEFIRQLKDRFKEKYENTSDK